MRLLVPLGLVIAALAAFFLAGVNSVQKPVDADGLVPILRQAQRTEPPAVTNAMLGAPEAMLQLDSAARADEQARTPPEKNGAAVIKNQLVLSFPGATGWKEEPVCSDVDARDACAGEWTADNGQKVRVLLLPVVDAERLGSLTKNLKQKVQKQGGVVDAIDLPGGKIVRMLQPLTRAEDDVDIVNITYLLVSPDQRLLHIVTSLVTQQQQVEADGRVRDLLAFAAWVQDDAQR